MMGGAESGRVGRAKELSLGRQRALEFSMSWQKSDSKNTRWRGCQTMLHKRLVACALVLSTLACEEQSTPSPPPPASASATGRASSTRSAAQPSPGASVKARPSAAPPVASSEMPWRRGGVEAPDSWGDTTRWGGSFEEQNALMFRQLEHYHGLSDKQLDAVKKVFANSKYIGQGNPAPSRHPASPAACRQKLEQQKVHYEDAAFESRCGGRFMAPLYNPEAGQTAKDARACMDRFEFPNIPCVYPVTWVRAREAVQICQAMGKRLCDAHEWEGACEGKLTPPDYDFDLFERMSQEDARKIMRRRANHRHRENKTWAYGPKARKDVCATASRKSRRCGVGWKRCGTNTFPAGFFPGCRSRLGIYDQHGNAAEHMNLPFAPEQLSTDPSGKYGHTEMKGSWFVFNVIWAHPDHCRWRAPYWHGNRVMSKGSHRNYHLGFRCCKSIAAKP